MSERQRLEALGVGLVALGVLVSLAVLSPLLGAGGAETNLIGPAGAFLRSLLSEAFGPAAVVVGVPAFLWAATCFGWLEGQTATRWTLLTLGVLFLLPAAGWLLSRALGGDGDAAGWIGGVIAGSLERGFGSVGAQLIMAAAIVSLLILTLGRWPLRLVRVAVRAIRRGGAGVVRLVAAGAGGAARWRRNRRQGFGRGSPWEREREEERGEEEDAGTYEADVPAARVATPPPAEGKPQGEPALPGETVDAARAKAGRDLLPPLDLLTVPEKGGAGLAGGDLERLGQIVIEKLRTFRVEGRIGGWTTGPVVTQFEVIPAEGVKVGQIAALADDLALALKAPRVRIVAPIPGKGAVGVEVPNPEPEIVHLREILVSAAYRRSRALLPLALGRDLDGQPYCADLAEMPHLLIAGATGTGKSVCINAIITSLIYRYSPAELRLLMIDPKMVELAVYNDLPHLRHPVVTDNHDAAAVLRWAVYEMGRRYRLLSDNACRNLLELNRRIRRGEARQEDAEGEKEPLPYVVVIIDELADLMMTVQAEVETPLAILAQKARAVGLHLVVATQRPSVNVVTGLIKANFPSRIAFRVASKIDSRTILDQNGAESLLGNGDMLFLPPAESVPHRIQGAFVSTAETERLVEWYREEVERLSVQPAGEEADILEQVKELDLAESRLEVEDELQAEWDPYFQKAAEIVIHNNSGSTSLLQRRLKIGYGRAARIIDQLHTAGVLGPPEGSRPREVLVNHDQLEALLRGEDLRRDASSADA